MTIRNRRTRMQLTALALAGCARNAPTSTQEAPTASQETRQRKIDPCSRPAALQRRGPCTTTAQAWSINRTTRAETWCMSNRLPDQEAETIAGIVCLMVMQGCQREG